MDKHKAVIVDLDGTLSKMDKRRHHLEKCPPDYHAYNSECMVDAPNEWCKQIVHALFMDSVRILIVSARPKEFYDETSEWLIKHRIPHDKIFLRASEADKRTDVEVKREIYETQIAPFYDVLFALDDKTRVVQLWRSLGLTCLQCEEGNYTW